MLVGSSARHARVQVRHGREERLTSPTNMVPCMRALMHGTKNSGSKPGMLRAHARARDMICAGGGGGGKGRTGGRRADRCVRAACTDGTGHRRPVPLMQHAHAHRPSSSGKGRQRGCCAASLSTSVWGLQHATPRLPARPPQVRPLSHHHELALVVDDRLGDDDGFAATGAAAAALWRGAGLGGRLLLLLLLLRHVCANGGGDRVAPARPRSTRPLGRCPACCCCCCREEGLPWAAPARWRRPAPAAATGGRAPGARAPGSWRTSRLTLTPPPQWCRRPRLRPCVHWQVIQRDGRAAACACSAWCLSLCCSGRERPKAPRHSRRECGAASATETMHPLARYRCATGGRSRCCGLPTPPQQVEWVAPVSLAFTL